MPLHTTQTLYSKWPYNCFCKHKHINWGFQISTYRYICCMHGFHWTRSLRGFSRTHLDQPPQVYSPLCETELNEVSGYHSCLLPSSGRRDLTLSLRCDLFSFSSQCFNSGQDIWNSQSTWRRSLSCDFNLLHLNPLKITQLFSWGQTHKGNKNDCMTLTIWGMWQARILYI